MFHFCNSLANIKIENQFGHIVFRILCAICTNLNQGCPLYGKVPWMPYSANTSYLLYMNIGISSQSTGLAVKQHPWRNLKFSDLFKGTLELMCEQPPFIAEYIVLWQPFLEKGYSRGLAVRAESPVCDLVPCSRALQQATNWSITKTTHLLQLEIEPATLLFFFHPWLEVYALCL